MIDSVTIVIRSSHERTEKLCHKITSLQAPEENIFIIHEVPFSKALLKNFIIGMEKGLKWTMGLDADVLLANRSIIDLVNLAESQPKNTFEVQGRVYDKLFCIPKPGGPHLYKTSLLRKAIKLLPEEGTDADFRPESYVFKNMAQMGYPYLHTDTILGIHDFEQYYKDIYRKAYVHAHKFKIVENYLINLWERYAKKDMDYHVALKGFIDGKTNQGSGVFIDISKFPSSLKKIDSLTELEEKGAISEKFSPLEVDSIINRYIQTEETLQIENILNPKPMYGKGVKANLLSNLHFLKKLLKKLYNLA